MAPYLLLVKVCWVNTISDSVDHFNHFTKVLSFVALRKLCWSVWSWACWFIWSSRNKVHFARAFIDIKESSIWLSLYLGSGLLCLIITLTFHFGLIGVVSQVCVYDSRVVLMQLGWSTPNNHLNLILLIKK